MTNKTEDAPVELAEPSTDAVQDRRPFTLAEKLAAYKEANAGDETLVLPMTDVTVTFPKFRSHGAMMKAQRLAKGDAQKATKIFAINVCRFDGEKMTLEDFDQLMPMADTNKLLARLFGDDEGDDAADEFDRDTEDGFPQH